MFVLLRRLFLSFLCLPSGVWAMTCTTTDDLGQVYDAAQPPQRVISLSPHITELVYSLGAEERLVAVSDYSDYPPAAQQLPVAAGYGTVNAEAILAFAPDLILAWPDKASASVLQRLEASGIRVLRSDPRDYAGIARNLRWLGRVLGKPERGEEQAQALEARVYELRQTFSRRRPVRVFYQLGGQPVFSQNKDTYIHQAIELCGGVNLFAEALAMAPLVSTEAVVALDPDVIITADDGTGMPPWLQAWQRFSMMKAVREGQLLAMNADLLFRPTLRFMDGTQQLCELIDRARESPVPEAP